jgi:hypothetical protein
MTTPTTPTATEYDQYWATTTVDAGEVGGPAGTIIQLSAYHWCEHELRRLKGIQYPETGGTWEDGDGVYDWLYDGQATAELMAGWLLGRPDDTTTYYVSSDGREMPIDGDALRYRWEQWVATLDAGQADHPTCYDCHPDQEEE